MPRGRPKPKKVPPPAASEQPPQDGAEPEPRPKQRPRRLGLGAAQRRATFLAAGADRLPPHKALLLRYTGRLAVHFENLSALTYYQTELRQDGEPRPALRTLLDYHDRLLTTWRYIFPVGDDGDADPLSTIFGGKKP